MCVRLWRVISAVGALIAVAVTPAGAGTPEPCGWEVEYGVSAKMAVTETPLGEGDGVYPIGPGKLTLRYEDEGGRPGGNVELLRFELREHLPIESRALFWKTNVLTDTETTVTPDGCSVAARGELEGQAIRWRTPVSGYRTDGWLTCKGSLCGKFGAPAPGRTPFVVPPAAVQFRSFVFAPDMQTFTMAATHVAKTSMPQESTAIMLAGREVRRACVPVRQCTP
jgi:hypothetical protein